jgi:hypothetical protein
MRQKRKEDRHLLFELCQPGRERSKRVGKLRPINLAEYGGQAGDRKRRAINSIRQRENLKGKMIVVAWRIFYAACTGYFFLLRAEQNILPRVWVSVLDFHGDTSTMHGQKESVVFNI